LSPAGAHEIVTVEEVNAVAVTLPGDDGGDVSGISVMFDVEIDGWEAFPAASYAVA
jgi:hypothetical protein